MKNKKHYIYEIKGVKVGCTKDVDYRIKMYKGKYTLEDLIVLEVLEDKTDIEAGEIERQYQKKLGYLVDKVPYHKSKKGLSQKGKIGAEKCHETNRKNKTGVCYNKELQSMGGEISAEVNRKNGSGCFFNKEIQSQMGKKGSKIAVENQRLNGTAAFAKIKCKYCDYVGNALIIGRHHNEKCKYKNIA